METRRRNQIIRAVHAIVGIVLLGVIVLIMWRTLEPKVFARWAIPIGIYIAIMIVVILRFDVQMRRVWRSLKDAGIRKEDVLPKEEPEPIVPTLAKGRTQLIGGCIVIGLTIALFIMYYTGMLGRLFEQLLRKLA